MGPVPVERLQTLLSSGDLPGDTLVWKRSMESWTPLTQIESLRDFVPDEAPTIPEPSRADEEETTGSFPPPDLETPLRPHLRAEQVRPWVRYFARQLDFALALAIYLSVVPHLAPGFVSIASPFFALPPVAIWVLLESVFIASAGTTPGKWILRIEIRGRDGAYPSFQASLQRAVSVWIRGLAMGLPILILFTQILGYRELTQQGITPWDRAGQLEVRHGHLDGARITLAVSVFLALALWASISLAPLMPQAGFDAL